MFFGGTSKVETDVNSFVLSDFQQILSLIEKISLMDSVKCMQWFNTELINKVFLHGYHITIVDLYLYAKVQKEIVFTP